MNIRPGKSDRTFVSGLLVLALTTIPLAGKTEGDPWEPRGLEAVWSAGHRSHPEFMDVRRMEYEQSQAAGQTTPKADPWAPKGLEAVWSAGHRSHPEFMDVRRREFETQKDAALSAGPTNNIVNLYEQGRRGQPAKDLLVTDFNQ